MAHGMAQHIRAECDTTQLLRRPTQSKLTLKNVQFPTLTLISIMYLFLYFYSLKMQVFTVLKCKTSLQSLNAVDTSHM